MTRREPEVPRRRRITTAEQEALAKVENGYVRMDEDGELLIIDDTAFFRHMDEQRRKKELTTAWKIEMDSGEMEYLKSEKHRARIASEWPMSRLVEMWNSLPGVSPVKRFTDRKKAVARISKALQSLAPATTTPQAPRSAPAEPVKGKSAKSADKPATARDGSKTARVLELLKEPGGATLTELMAATGWQAHSVRGFLSGALGKKMRLTIVSAKRDKDRVYSITT